MRCAVSRPEHTMADPPPAALEQDMGLGEAVPSSTDSLGSSSQKTSEDRAKRDVLAKLFANRASTLIPLRSSITRGGSG